VLRLGHGLTPPIVDLHVDGWGIRATLTFGGVPHKCLIPWEALYAVVTEDGRGLVWPESTPPEAARDFAGKSLGDGGEEDEEPPEPDKPKGGKGHLRLV
jgi:stringent starvation protein B